MISTLSNKKYFQGQLLFASPDMRDPRFSQAVIIICQHNAKGAMGIIINKPLPKILFKELINQFNLRNNQHTPDHTVYFGGPVDTSRGFILHTDDYVSQDTESIIPGVSITATVDVVRLIATNNGPQKYFLALGYTGWSGGQLEKEININSWLITKSDISLLFDTPSDQRWKKAYKNLGLSPGQFVNYIGQT